MAAVFGGPEVSRPLGPSVLPARAGYALADGYLRRRLRHSQAFERTAQTIDRVPFEYAAFWVCLEGQLVGDFDGTSVEMGPGDVVAFDLMQPFRLTMTDCSCDCVVINRNELRSSIAARSLHGGVLRASDPLARLLARYVETLFEVVWELGAARAEATMRAFTAIAVKAWERTDAIGPGVEPVRQTLERAIALIGNELGNPALSPAMLTARLGISRNLLYRLFQPYGGVRSYILGSRLEACLRDLINAEGSVVGVITKVSAHYGFRSNTHFSRVFRERFDRAPRAVLGIRQKVLLGAASTKWLQPHAERYGFESVQAWLNVRP